MFGIDLITLIKALGILGVLGAVFAESGLFIGFFLPGDSLLFTAGFLSSQGYFSPPLLMAGSFIAAVLGDNVGYAFGKRVGPKIFKREDSLLFHQNHLEKAQRFYEKHGGKTIILARFMPIVRTCAPILAGVGKMEYRVFFFYNVIGGFLWAVGLTGLGYFLGSSIPGIDRYIIPIVLFIIVISVVPPFIHVMRSREHREEFKQTARKFFSR